MYTYLLKIILIIIKKSKEFEEGGALFAYFIAFIY